MKKFIKIGSDLNIILFMLKVLGRDKAPDSTSLTLKSKLQTMKENEIAGMKFYNLELRRN